MGFLVRKQRGVYAFTGIARLSLITFIVTIAYSFVDTIWAVYLDGIFNSVSIISFVSAFLTAIAFLFYFIFIPIIEKNNKSKIYMLSLFFVGLSYIAFIFNRNLVLFFIIATLLTIFTTLRINAFGIIIRDKSQKKSLARNEGLLYTFFNIAWLIGPLIAGYIAQAYGINTIFILSAIFVFLGLFLFKISNINDANIKRKPDKHLVKNFIEFFSSRDRVFAYIVSGGMSFWLMLIYLYMPLIIIQAGLDDIWIGYFLFATAIPLVLLEFPISKFTGKIGFRKIFVAGFLILTLSALICFFLNNIFLILLVLFLSSIGLAMLEPTCEAYFFDILEKKEDETKFYGPFNTAIDVIGTIGKVMIGVFLLVFPIKVIFLFFAFFMFLYFLASMRVRDVRECAN